MNIPSAHQVMIEWLDIHVCDVQGHTEEIAASNEFQACKDCISAANAGNVPNTATKLCLIFV